jgi:hypothetical protein
MPRRDRPARKVNPSRGILAPPGHGIGGSPGDRALRAGECPRSAPTSARAGQGMYALVVMAAFPLARAGPSMIMLHLKGSRWCRSRGAPHVTVNALALSTGHSRRGALFVPKHDSSGHGQASVVDEVNGTWGKAKEVPGTAALNQGGVAQCCRCRAPRRVPAASAGYTPTALASCRHSSSARPNQRARPESQHVIRLVQGGVQAPRH